MNDLDKKVLESEGLRFVSLWSDLMCRTTAITRKCIREVSEEVPWSSQSDIIEGLQLYRDYLQLLHQDIEDLVTECGHEEFPEFPEIQIKKSSKVSKDGEYVYVEPFLKVQQQMDEHAARIINICIESTGKED